MLNYFKTKLPILFSLVIILGIFISMPQKTYAKTCCPADTTPYLGKCIQNFCKTCLMGTDCNEASVRGQGNGRAYCQTSWDHAAGYACEKPLKSDPVNNPGEACDEINNLCLQLQSVTQTGRCVDGRGDCVRTAIGMIDYDFGSFLSQAIKIGISVGSGLAFLALIYGSFKLIMSKGNPDGINEGKEVITSAVAGLVFIILTVTIIQIIGIDILGLKTLGF